MKTKITSTVAVFFLSVLCNSIVPRSSYAGIIIDVQETGGDVVFSYSGSLDLTGLTPAFANAMAGSGSSARINPSNPTFLGLELGSTPGLDVYSGIIAPLDLDYGTSAVTTGNARSGDHFGFLAGPTGSQFLYLPTGYNGGALSGSLTFSSSTFASLGLNNAGDPYVWHLTNTPADTITMQFGSAASVPEPSQVATLTLGLLGAGCLAVRRRMMAAQIS